MRMENFEDGMESVFSQKLVALIRENSDGAREKIIFLVSGANAEIASEALRWLGRTDHPPSYYFRLWLLERSLNSPSARVRDGAILGLSSLDDPHTASAIELAVERERCAELRKDMEQALAGLRSSGRKNC